MRVMSALLVAVVLCLVALDAFATSIPKITGKYAFTLTQVCQIDVTQIQNACQTCDGDVHDILTNDTGKVRFSVANLTATPGSGTPNAGTMQVVSKDGRGALIFYRPKSNASDNITEQSLSQTVPYSNTASTFTFNGDLFNAVYGNIVNGVAKYVAIERIDTQKACVLTGTAVHQ